MRERRLTGLPAAVGAMRVVGAVLLLLALAIAGGCGRRTKGFQGTLRLVDGPHRADPAVLGALLRQFEEENPGVRVELLTRDDWPEGPLDPGWDRAWADLARLAEGSGVPEGSSGVDVALAPLDPDRVELLEPWTAEALGSELSPSAVEAFRARDQVWGVPVLVDLQALFLNRAAFEAAGVALPGPGGWSVGEFESTARRISQTGRAGLGFHLLEGFLDVWPLLLIDGAPVLGDDWSRLGLDSPEGRRSLARLADWTRNGVADPASRSQSPLTLWRNFAGGEAKVAMVPWGLWAIPALRGEEFKTDFELAPLPWASAASPAALGSATGAVVFRQSDPARREAAFTLARFLSQDEAARRLARAHALVPARKSAGNPWPDDPAYAQAMVLAQDFEPLPAVSGRDALVTAVGRQVRLAAAGGLSADEALARAAEEAGRILRGEAETPNAGAGD